MINLIYRENINARRTWNLRVWCFLQDVYLAMNLRRDECRTGTQHSDNQQRHHLKKHGFLGDTLLWKGNWVYSPQQPQMHDNRGMWSFGRTPLPVCCQNEDLIPVHQGIQNVVRKQIQNSEMPRWRIPNAKYPLHPTHNILVGSIHVVIEDVHVPATLLPPRRSHPIPPSLP